MIFLNSFVNTSRESSNHFQLPHADNHQATTMRQTMNFFFIVFFAIVEPRIIEAISSKFIIMIVM